MRWLALLVLSTALVAAGCGGGSNESAATTETTTAETTTTESTESTESTDTTDLSGILSDKDCLALAGIGATIAQAFSGSTSGDTNTEELQQLVDKVPDEIQGDVQTLADAFGQYAAKLKDIGIKVGSTPSAAQLQQLQAAIASLNQQKLTAASQHIQAWAKDNCTG
jgi:ABC-type glycerol-3-phosphate transport system substrate-binding protein